MIRCVADLRIVGRKANGADITGGGTGENFGHRIAAIGAAKDAGVGSQVEDIALLRVKADAANVGGGQPIDGADGVPRAAPVAGTVGAAEITGGQHNASWSGAHGGKGAAAAGGCPLPLARQAVRAWRGCFSMKGPHCVTEQQTDKEAGQSDHRGRSVGEDWCRAEHKRYSSAAFTAQL